MKLNNYKSATLLVALLLTFSSFGFAQKAKKPVAPPSLIQERNVRAELEFLASDAMQGRGSGTQFEWITAQYLGSQMQQFGIEPAGEKDANGNLTYVQTIEVTGRSFLQKLNVSKLRPSRHLRFDPIVCLPIPHQAGMIFPGERILSPETVSK